MLGEGGSLDPHREFVLTWIDRYDYTFIEAATGMGKSTRIPQYVMDADPKNVVWQLQPRRLAAKRLAEYVGGVRAAGPPFAEDVGYRVRSDVCVNDRSRLVYMTTGYFLHFVLHQLRLVDRRSWCTHLFIDEVHEASEEIELVLLLVRMLGEAGSLPFKVIILSATLDFDILHDYFVRSADADIAGRPAAQPLAATNPSRMASESDDESNVESASVPGEALLSECRVELSLGRSDSAPLGIVFCAGDESGSEDRLTVLRVQKRSSGYGRLRPGDRLELINGIRALELPTAAIRELCLLRPLSLYFRRLPATPLNAAPQVMRLCIETPFPVKICYLDEIEGFRGMSENFKHMKHLRGSGPDRELMDMCARLLLDSCRSVDDSALVFLPGIAEIEHFHRCLERQMDFTGRSVDVVILHSITLSEKCEVRRPADSTLPTAYIASSIAETSITLPDLSFIFDFGLSRGTRYIPQLEMDQLETRVGSRTAAKQRAGRVGRIKAGTVFRMYPRKIWDSMPASDSWGPSDVKRSLESTILLLTKTLVPYLGLPLEECLALLVRAPSAAATNGAITRLEELDALSLETQGNPQLTAFGEFAVCISVIGARMARLLYCGLLFHCTRSAIAVAATHTVCGRGDLLLALQDARGARDEEVAEDEVIEASLDNLGDADLGIFWGSIEGDGWKVADVDAGSWADRACIQKGDVLVQVMDNFGMVSDLQALVMCDYDFSRYSGLRFQRPSLLLPKEKDWTYSPAALRQLVHIAKNSIEVDQGIMSEPIAGLTLLDMFFSRRVKDGICSLHKLRQVDGMCREIGAKLRCMASAVPAPSGRRGSQLVLQNIHEDTHFWRCDFEHSLADQADSQGSSFLWRCLEPDQLRRLHLVFCAAFSANFLFATLDTRPVELVPPQDNDPGSDSSTERPRGAEAPSRSEEEVVPPLTLRAAPPALDVETIQRNINRTYGIVAPLLNQAQGQPPGNFIVSFAGASVTRHHIGFADLNGAALLNMVVARDPRNRLQVFELDGRVVSYGQFHVVPTWKWHLLRVPSLTIKTPMRLTPLARSGPVVGIGPELPKFGPGANGFRLAISMELEATKFQERQGRTFKAGKAVQSFRTSWLPNDAALDLVLLLTFWTREMELIDVTQNGRTVYAAIKVGLGFTVTFPDDDPLLPKDFEELRRWSHEVRLALISGRFRENALPSIRQLQEWGLAHLSRASVLTPRRFAFGQASTASIPAGYYSHRTVRRGVSLSVAPGDAVGASGRHFKASSLPKVGGNGMVAHSFNKQVPVNLRCRSHGSCGEAMDIDSEPDTPSLSEDCVVVVVPEGGPDVDDEPAAPASMRSSTPMFNILGGASPSGPSKSPGRHMQAGSGDPTRTWQLRRVSAGEVPPSFSVDAVVVHGGPMPAWCSLRVVSNTCVVPTAVGARVAAAVVAPSIASEASEGAVDANGSTKRKNKICKVGDDGD